MGGNPSLWRYMPLTGLVRLLQKRTLHVTRSDLFEDILEGRFGFDVIEKHLGQSFGGLVDVSVRELKRDTYLSCWHRSSSESLAMWRLYGRSDSSVAIESGVSEVMSAANAFCEASGHVGMFGDVVYNDPIVDGKWRASAVGLPFGRRERETPQMALVFFCKAPAFAYEQEWRLVIWKRAAGPTSVAIPIPADNFIKRVLVAPEARNWVVDAVTELVQQQFGLRGIPVERSGLSQHVRIS
jgi:hypothetical protein